MKSKLQIYHLAPYITYGVNMMANNGIIYKLTGDSSGQLTSSDRTKNTCDISFAIKYKPILRPLSDLLDRDKDYWIELGEVLGTMHPHHFSNALINKSTYALSHEKWLSVSEFLDKNHFDWRYNLIKEGLAININNLK